MEDPKETFGYLYYAKKRENCPPKLKKEKSTARRKKRDKRREKGKEKKGGVGWDRKNGG